MHSFYKYRKDMERNSVESKYFDSSKSVSMKRSQIKPASYNPRAISDEGKKALKRSIKLYGVVGGIVVNQATGYTIVGGHQKVAVLDELNKYDKSTHENDYNLRVELINVDEKIEKQLNITLNNPNVGGNWDYDKMRELIPDIDYKDAGLTEADLNMIGVDFLLQTEEENDLASALEDMMSPVTEKKAEEKAQKQAEKQLEREAKIQHMKDVKAQVKEQAQKTAQDMDAYLMLSFDTFEAKAEFCDRFGINPYDKFFKGETFGDMCEVIID